MTKKVLKSDKPLNQYQLNILNYIIAKNKLKINSNFSRILKENFLTNINSADLAKNAKSVTNSVNQWIKKETNNKIEKLLDLPLDPLTQFLTINAVYFKG